MSRIPFMIVLNLIFLLGDGRCMGTLSSAMEEIEESLKIIEQAVEQIPRRRRYYGESAENY